MKRWNAGIYIRLSKEDDNKINESTSVTNQREIINRYILDNEDIFVYDYYVDDGYSGTSIDRPAFKRLNEDIIKGRVDMVICKDLSRLGRNYLDVGNYLERVFPSLNVRFVSISDNIDSYKDPGKLDSILIPFKNIMNDEYSKDISNKVKMIIYKGRKEGKYYGSLAPFGYKKSKEDIHKLEVDIEASKVVKLIYELSLKGEGFNKIAKRLNDLNYPSPSLYRNKDSNLKLWNESVISQILHNKVYIGSIVQGKSKVISYKVHKKVKTDEEIEVENMHEAIIDKEVFYKVQEGLKLRSHASTYKSNAHLLQGKLKCSKCNHALKRYSKLNKNGRRTIYICPSYLNKTSVKCENNKIAEESLYDYLIKDINKMIEEIKGVKDKLILIKDNPSYKLDYDNLIRSLTNKEDCYLKIMRVKEEVHQSYINGKIELNNYLNKCEELDNALMEIIENIRIIKEKKLLFELDITSLDFYYRFMKFEGIRYLNKDVIDSLIVSIHVGDKIEVRYLEDNLEEIKRFIAHYE